MEELREKGIEWPKIQYLYNRMFSETNFQGGFMLGGKKCTCIRLFCVGVGGREACSHCHFRHFHTPYDVINRIKISEISETDAINVLVVLKCIHPTNVNSP